MAFDVTVPKDGKSILLKNRGTGNFAEIFSFGALLNQFGIRKDTQTLNVIDGFSDPADAEQHISSSFKSAKLSPFVCRLRNGVFSFENQEFELSKFYIGKHAIHGLLFDAPFEIGQYHAGDHAASVSLHYHYDKTEEGFPFPFTADITYTLEENNIIRLLTCITNTGPRTMPLSDGWHPYFKTGSPVNSLILQINSHQLIEFDAELIPTGNRREYSLFSEAAPIGETSFDNCFALNETDRPACILQDPARGIELSIIPSASYPYLQLFTPADRNSIAVENLSSLPDAFNNGTGLIRTVPGESRSFETCYQLTILST